MLLLASAPLRLCVLASLLALMTVSVSVPAQAVRPLEAEHIAAAPRLKVDPRKTRGLYVDPMSSAALAAASDPRFNPIARRPQALWITDFHAVASVQGVVRDYTSDANAANKTPMLTIYAIPGRDCGLSSAGGLPDGPSYRAWIREVAAGVKDQRAIVVLEPDAVAFMDDKRCLNSGPRQRLLTYATERLSQAGAWVYLDAGHSGWRSPTEMAPLLKASGIEFARGFSTNVANFQQSNSESTYAVALTRELGRTGVRGKRYVIDRGRSGADLGPSNGGVCNPPQARIGRPPRMIFDGQLDGYLWIKHPGESDGQSSPDDATDPCHGGPPAGNWWPEGALRLLGKAS